MCCLASLACRAKGAEAGLQMGSPSPPVLQSSLPRTVIHFSSCVPSRCLFSLHLPTDVSPCLCDVFMLRCPSGVCGIVLWAGSWQRLIRERISCAIPSELISFFFFHRPGQTLASFHFFFFFLKDLAPSSPRQKPSNMKESFHWKPHVRRGLAGPSFSE